MSYDREKYAVAYAKALEANTSIEAGIKLIDQITNLNQVIVDYPDLVKAFASHRLPSDVERNLVEVLCGDDKLLKNFFLLLVKNGHINILDRINKKFKDINNRRQGLMDFKVSVTYLPDAEQQKKLEETLKSRFNLNEVHIDYRVDKDLVGGIIVKSDAYLIDDSIKTRMKRVRDSLFHMNIKTKELEA